MCSRVRNPWQKRIKHFYDDRYKLFIHWIFSFIYACSTSFIFFLSVIFRCLFSSSELQFGIADCRPQRWKQREWKWTKMKIDENGQKWTKMDENENQRKWWKMKENGRKWTNKDVLRLQVAGLRPMAKWMVQVSRTIELVEFLDTIVILEVKIGFQL